MIVCVCHAVTDTDVVEHVLSGCRTPDDVAAATGASTGCGSCRERLCGLVQATVGAESARTAMLDASVA